MVAFAASLLGMFGPAAQFIHVRKTRSVKGLSLSTFTILNLSLMCSLLLGIQYRVGYGLIFAFSAWAVKLAVLCQLNVRVALALVGLGAAVAAAALFGPPLVSRIILTSQYSEFVAFAWGLLLAIAFLPQVWMSHKSGNTKNLSLPGVVISAFSTALWIAFALLVANHAMLFWCSVMLVALLELIRLKLGVRATAADILTAPSAGSV
jgi:uncharacterized protein with PQ loop repeat